MNNINPELTKWLKSEIEYHGDNIVIVASTVENYRLLVQQCHGANLLEISDIDHRLNIHYRLTDDGKRELGITPVVEEPKPSTRWNYNGVRVFDTTHELFAYRPAFFANTEENSGIAVSILNMYEDETRKLHQQLATAQTEAARNKTAPSAKDEQIVILRRELQATLGVIRDAYARLSNDVLKDYDKVDMAKEILEPYTEPKESES